MMTNERLSQFQDQYIQLAHGNGGRFMRDLIDNLFAEHLNNPLLDTNTDAAVIPLSNNQEIMVTTDGFTVKPLEFPGGDIGSLAVHGTINDLCVSGAIPKYLTLNAFIEEGLEIAQLDRIILSLATAARKSNVVVVAGDTKVLARGEGGGLYLATTGVGERKIKLGMEQIAPDDVILISGPIGDHGTAVMLAREQFGMRGDLQSDSASVLPLAQALWQIPGLKFMRDPTRGGLASVLYEICQVTGLSVRLFESQIPIRDSVRSVCEMLGYDPYYLACEGRIVAVVAAETAELALTTLQAFSSVSSQAAKIGLLLAGEPHLILETELGGERFLEQLEDEPLPRIC